MRTCRCTKSRKSRSIHWILCFLAGIELYNQDLLPPLSFLVCLTINWLSRVHPLLSWASDISVASLHIICSSWPPLWNLASQVATSWVSGHCCHFLVKNLSPSPYIRRQRMSYSAQYTERSTPTNSAPIPLVLHQFDWEFKFISFWANEQAIYFSSNGASYPRR